MVVPLKMVPRLAYLDGRPVWMRESFHDHELSASGGVAMAFSAEGLDL